MICLKKIEEKSISSVVGEDWNTPRARLYILALLSCYLKAGRDLQRKLDFETTVNTRVMEVVQEMLSTYLATQMLKKPAPWEIDPKGPTA